MNNNAETKKPKQANQLGSINEPNKINEPPVIGPLWKPAKQHWSPGR